jgi:hypothetical protein
MDSAPPVQASAVERLLEDVEAVLGRVKEERRQGRYDEARAALREEAIEPLRAALEALSCAGDGLSETLRDLRDRVARELANCWGSEGGLYRRQDRWAEARASYERGRSVEQDPRYGIADSYNLTNALAASVFQDPASLPALGASIREAAEVVAGQVSGERRNSYWALADLGLLLLLSGRPEEARAQAYARYRALKGIPDWAHQSTLDVLAECRDRLRETAPPVASSIDEAIDYLKEYTA